MNARRILTLAEVASTYSVSRQTIHSWMADGLVAIDVGTPHDKATGRRLPRLFWADVVQAHVNKRKAEGRWLERGPDKGHRTRRNKGHTKPT